MDLRYFPAPETFPESTDLVGKRANFHYASGHVLQQYYASADTIVWRGVRGPFEGYEQSDPTLRTFKIAEDIYYITWYEKSTVATAEHGESFEHGYPVCVVADFKRLVGTAVYTNPLPDGGQYFTVDQATIELVDA